MEEKNLGEITKFSTIDKCCATSLGTLEVEGTTSGAEPTSKTRTKFQESHVPYNLFCPLKVEPRRSQTKNKTHDSFAHVCHKIAVFATPHACTFDPCEERFGGHLCKLCVI
jgi:hypothetical protein